MDNEIKIISEHWGKISPFKIEDYLSIGGYEALKKFLQEMDRESVLRELKESKLCGRGGAGFLTATKWELVVSQEGEKYFICNLDESEPGTYKDRAIVKNNPHALLEGVIISALTVGAQKAYIYINGSYVAEEEILRRALQDSLEKKYWGEKILGSEYSLEIEMFIGAGAYICGEETALINSIEGNRGEPKLRPPYPTQAGLFGRPTVVNNAETIVNVPWIIQNGGKKYFELGVSENAGTKLFVLGGEVKRRGVFEAPLGITVRQAIEELGGGMKQGKEFWFAQIGGASGRIILEQELDMQLGFGEGALLGSGAILVVDKSANIYDLLLSWTGFFRRESCGKCVPCREGTFRLHEIVERLEDGEICERDKQSLEDILWTLENTTFCPLGKFSAVAMRDALEKLKIF